MISLIWILIVHVRTLLQKPDLHPGHHVAWDLICWLVLLGCTLSALFFSHIIDLLDIDVAPPSCEDGYPGSTDSNCYDNFAALKWVQVAAYTLTFAVGICHFILFVRACRVCKRYNRQKKMMLPLKSEVELGQVERTNGHF